jgi:hypothetical protein
MQKSLIMERERTAGKQRLRKEKFGRWARSVVGPGVGSSMRRLDAGNSSTIVALNKNQMTMWKGGQSLQRHTNSDGSSINATPIGSTTASSGNFALPSTVTPQYQSRLDPSRLDGVFENSDCFDKSVLMDAALESCFEKSGHGHRNRHNDIAGNNTTGNTTDLSPGLSPLDAEEPTFPSTGNLNYTDSAALPVAPPLYLDPVYDSNGPLYNNSEVNTSKNTTSNVTPNTDSTFAGPGLHADNANNQFNSNANNAFNSNANNSFGLNQTPRYCNSQLQSETSFAAAAAVASDFLGSDYAKSERERIEAVRQRRAGMVQPLDKNLNSVGGNDNLNSAGGNYNSAAPGDGNTLGNNTLENNTMGKDAATPTTCASSLLSSFRRFLSKIKSFFVSVVYFLFNTVSAILTFAFNIVWLPFKIFFHICGLNLTPTALTQGLIASVKLVPIWT